MSPAGRVDARVRHDYDVVQRAGSRGWHAWHEPYDLDGSPLQVRLGIVQQRIGETLNAAPPGPIQVVSAYAGQGRDLLPILVDHPRGSDVRARLVELDPRNAEVAAAYVAAHDLTGVEVINGDASQTNVYLDAVPADLVLFCGIWGNVTDADVERSARALPGFCAPGATVIWTRHRKAPDLTGAIRGWLAEAGFTEVAFDAPEDLWISVGTHRYAVEALSCAPVKRCLRSSTTVADTRA